MKILQLKLLAFGPFTDVTINLNGGKDGLHLIYGPNEAGKSSALRALRQMLFGIPVRSADNFHHPHQQMRIGGVLRHSDGSIIEFIRRKGRMNTLHSGDDREVLDDAVLQRFLGPVSADVFETMFGIGHEDLVRGGQEIIRGGGSVGQALFAAGSGITDLHEVQATLEKEADELFSPSASKRAINELLAEVKSNQKQLKEAELPGQEWERHDRALREAIARRAEVDQQLAGNVRETSRLERVRDALPLIGRRKELLQTLINYAQVVLLPEGFGERRVKLLSDLRVAESSRDQARHSLAEIEKEMHGLEVDEVILENADLIEALSQEVGSHRKAVRDRVQLATRRDVLRSEAKEILSRLRDDLTLEDAGNLNLKRATTVRIQELGVKYERLVTMRESADEEGSRLVSALARIREEMESLEPPKSVDDLVVAVERAEEYGPLEGVCDSEFSEIESSEQLLRAALARQPLRLGQLEEVETLKIPVLETIDRFEKELAEASEEVNRLKSVAAEIEQELIAVRGSIESLRLEQEVPTEQDLIDARKLRDEGWGLVRKALEEGREDAETVARFAASVKSDGTLAEVYELSVKQADEIADRLRREADRVAAKAKLLADEQTKSTQLERIGKELAEATERLARVDLEWSVLWQDSGITPLTPREMRSWCQELKAAAEEVSKLRVRRAKAEALRTDIERRGNDLDQSLQALGEPAAAAGETLQDLIRRCQRVIRRQEELGRTKEQLLSDMKTLERHIQEARAKAEGIDSDLDQWQRHWQEAVSPLGLGGEATPGQASAFIEGLKELFDKLREAETIQKRIRGIDRDAEKFSQDLGELAERVAPELRALKAERQVSELNARLKRAREGKTEKEGLQKQYERQIQKLKETQKTISEVGAELASMCKEAGCESYDELAEAERRSTIKLKIENELEELEKQLRKLGGGATVDEFVAMAEQEDPDTLETRIERLREEGEELGGERSDLDQAIGRARTVLEGMKGSASAADLAEKRQQLLGHLETAVEKYVRLRLASAVLARTIEQYREKHQGPILERTNELFSRLTLGSFEGVRAEYNQRGEPVLMGVRPGGRELIGVEGMSDGTTDQLYLALRLASLEAYLQKSEPMPFIVDDILIRFDNNRAQAALEILGEISHKTQVIFFTHHSHLVELAEETLGSGVFRCFLGSSN